MAMAFRARVVVCGLKGLRLAIGKSHCRFRDRCRWFSSSATDAMSRGDRPEHVVVSKQERGFEYEHESVHVLGQRASFALQVTQKSYDRGVDMRGTWMLKPHDHHSEKGEGGGGSKEDVIHVPVVGQCKREKGVIGANYIRDLEGVLQQYNSGGSSSSSSNNSDMNDDTKDRRAGIMTIGVFVSREGFSEHARKHVVQSYSPIILATVREGMLTHWFMNRAMTKALAPLEVMAVQSNRNIIGKNRNRSMDDSLSLFQILSDGTLVPLSIRENDTGNKKME